MPHKPVLLQEVVQWLNLKPGMTVVDATVGAGGHTLALLKGIGPGGRLIGLDRDPTAVARCRDRFKDFQGRISLHTENFKNLGEVLDSLNIPAVDAVILDVGISSEQLEDPLRGFGFGQAGPLDMRMDPEGEVRARDLVNDLSEKELEGIFRNFGEERRSRPIARAICEAREKQPLETTDALARVIEQALPASYRGQGGQRPPWARRHPATRVFQALRIAVNDELGALREGLPRIWRRLGTGGRLAVISFHSLEDRIVKNQFRCWAQAGEGNRLTKKPLRPTREEILANPRARSAKARVVEKKR